MAFSSSKRLYHESRMDIEGRVRWWMRLFRDRLQVHVAVRLKLASIPVVVHLVGSEFHTVDRDLNIPLKSNDLQWLDRLNSRSDRIDKTSILSDHAEPAPYAEYHVVLRNNRRLILGEDRKTRDQSDT